MQLFSLEQIGFIRDLINEQIDEIIEETLNRIITQKITDGTLVNMANLLNSIDPAVSANFMSRQLRDGILLNYVIRNNDDVKQQIRLVVDERGSNGDFGRILRTNSVRGTYGHQPVMRNICMAMDDNRIGQPYVVVNNQFDRLTVLPGDRDYSDAIANDIIGPIDDVYYYGGHTDNIDEVAVFGQNRDADGNEIMKYGPFKNGGGPPIHNGSHDTYYTDHM